MHRYVNEGQGPGSFFSKASARMWGSKIWPYRHLQGTINHERPETTKNGHLVPMALQCCPYERDSAGALDRSNKPTAYSYEGSPDKLLLREPPASRQTNNNALLFLSNEQYRARERNQQKISRLETNREAVGLNSSGAKLVFG